MVLRAGFASCALEVAGVTFQLPERHCATEIKLHVFTEKSGTNQCEEAMK